MRHPTMASRSFVLAALRALHLDPTVSPARARAHDAALRTRRQHLQIPTNLLTRPHSFRDADLAYSGEDEVMQEVVFGSEQSGLLVLRDPRRGDDGEIWSV